MRTLDQELIRRRADRAIQTSDGLASRGASLADSPCHARGPAMSRDRRKPDDPGSGWTAAALTPVVGRPARSGDDRAVSRARHELRHHSGRVARRQADHRQRANRLGYPGSAEVVNMQPPAALMKQGVMTLPTMGDGRQSGTSGSPSILNISPEVATGGGLAPLKTGDRIRSDLDTREVDVLLPPGELAARRTAWVPPKPLSVTPWEE